MKKIISLDCDGVIADVGKVFKTSFYKRFGKEISAELIKALSDDKLREYAEKNNLDYQELLFFHESYMERLYAELPNLDVVDGAIQGIKKLKNKGIEVIVNSYRPSHYKVLKQDTSELTYNWFKKNGIDLPVNITEGEKLALISQPNIVAHVDDNKGLLIKLKSLHPKKDFNPIFFNQYYEPDKDIPSASSWGELSDLLIKIYKNA